MARTQSIRSDDSMALSNKGQTKIANDVIPEYRDVDYKEIMYYKPTSLAVYGFIASVFCSLSLPLFGFVLSKYIFVLSQYNGA